MKESSKKSTDSHPMTSLSYHSHGEESLNHTQSMVSRTQLGNGSIKIPSHLLRKETLETRRLRRESLDSSMLTTVCTQPHTQEKSTPTMVISTQASNTYLSHKRLILVTSRSERKFMDSWMPTTACTQPHIQERSTPSTESWIQLSNTWPKRTRLISVTNKSERRSTDSSTLTTACTQLHTQEKSTPSTESWTQHSNTCHKSKTLETQSTWDQMCTISWMRTLVKFQPTEEKLHQSTTSSQENLDKELILSQLVQAQQLLPRRRLPSHKFKVAVKVRPRHQLPHLQKRSLFCSHWNTNTEQTPILQTWELLSMLNRSE